jgi:putrescine transport system ATP-binding protein
LFPHLTVAGNVAFGLKQDGLPKREIAARVDEMLALVQLTGFAARKPDQLSGGQRQRVALARSLAKRPRLLLLDEPMAALDKKLRGETQFELMQLQEKLGLTFIIVTHDQQEAMTVADRIAVMDRGRLIQVAAPPEIYEQPNSRWVADFIGDVNLIEGRVVETGAGGTTIASAAMGQMRAAASTEAKPGDTVWVALRPEKVRIAQEPPATAADNCVSGQVSNIGYLGDVSIYQVRLDNGFVIKAALANMTRLVERPIGWDDRVWLTWAPDAAVVLTR